MKARTVNLISNRFQIFFLVLISTTLASCTTTKFQSKSIEYTDTVPVTAIYLYSFLDLREGILGPRFIDEVKHQFPAATSQEGIALQQLWFNDSPLRAQFSLEAVKTNSGSKTRVPVDEVIQANQENERSFGASHRLIAFPSSVMASTTANSFDIRWALVNTKTNQVSWATTSFSYHQVWFGRDDNPQERAKTFVQGFMSELRKAKVIQSKQSQIETQPTASSAN